MISKQDPDRVFSLEVVPDDRVSSGDAHPALAGQPAPLAVVMGNSSFRRVRAARRMKDMMTSFPISRAK